MMGAVILSVPSQGIPKNVERKIRMCNAFKAVSSAYYDEMFRHPWKIPFFVSPTTFGAGLVVMGGTLLYFATTSDKVGVRVRTRIQEALKGDIKAEHYHDLIDQNSASESKFDITTLAMTCYLWDWTVKYLHASLGLQQIIMDDGKMKEALGWVLRLKKPAP